MNDDNNDNGLFISSIWKNVQEFFVAMFKSVWANFMDFWPALLSRSFEKLSEWFQHIEPAAWDNLLDSYVNQGLLTQDQANQMKGLKDLSTPMDILVWFYLNIQLLGTLLSINTDAAGNFMRQQLNENMRSNLPDYRDIVQAAFIAPEKTGEVRDVMRKHGLPENMIDMIFLSMYRLYNEDTIRELYLRKELTEEQTYMRLRELGYTDTRITELTKLWQVIPPIQDIITMVAKEAFEPDIVEEIGLDAEFPVEQTEWLEKQGLSSFWQHNYWRSHWEQPSIQMGFEMLHRGVISKDILDMLFRIVEIPPYWRDKLTQIAYMPYTRVDVRRMHDLGVLSDEDVIKAYMDLGYDYEHAIGMTEFTIDYNIQNDKDLTKQQITKSYLNGLITREDAVALLMQLKYSEAKAEYVLEYAEYDRQLDYQDQIIKNIQKRYQDNLITSLEAQSQLDKLNITPQQRAIYLDTWEVNRLVSEKKPSKTDLDKFLRNKVITTDQYRNEMERLGYGFEYINWYQQLVEMKKAG